VRGVEARPGLQPLDEGIDERRGDCAILIELWVEDRDVETGHSTRTNCDLKDLDQFLPRQSARHPVIDRWHDSVIEHIGIEVHPEARKLGLG
jgi:hypothetical protein